jgi:hypothetical protein
MRETSVEELMGQFKSIKECAEQYKYAVLLDEDIDEDEPTEWELDHLDDQEDHLDDLKDDLDDEEWSDQSVGYDDPIWMLRHWHA